MRLKLPDNQRLAAIGLDYADGHHVEPHDHPQAQLLYAASGLMRLVTRQGAWVIPPTRAVWIPPGIRHEIHMSGEVHMRTLFIRADACPQNLSDCCVLAVTPLLREMILRCIRWQAQPGEPALPLLEQLILLEIATLQRLPLALPLPTDRRLRAICKALLRHPEHPHTLEDWGQQVGASSRTLARLFRQELGMSYQEWRQQLRLTEALPRLLAGENVQSVATALGYASGRAFSAMFRRLLGENPREYLQALSQLSTLKHQAGRISDAD